MNPQEHNMAVLGQIVKLIPKKLIEKLKKSAKFKHDRFLRPVMWLQCSTPS